MTHLLVLSPTRGTVSDRHADTLCRLAIECHERGIKLSRRTSSVPGLLPHSRNLLFAESLELGATHVLWLDADVSFDARLVFDVLDRPEDMIARAYPQRDVRWDAVADAIRDGARTSSELERAAYSYGVDLIFHDGRPVWSSDGQLVEIDRVGFGWVLVRMEAMREFASWLRAHVPEVECHDWAGHRVIRAFDLRVGTAGAIPWLGVRGDTAPVMIGEDYSHQMLWRQSGRRIWCAPFDVVRNGTREGAFVEYLRDHGLIPAGPHEARAQIDSSSLARALV